MSQHSGLRSKALKKWKRQISKGVREESQMSNSRQEWKVGLEQTRSLLSLGLWASPDTYLVHAKREFSSTKLGKGDSAGKGSLSWERKAYRKKRILLERRAVLGQDNSIEKRTLIMANEHFQLSPSTKWYQKKILSMTGTTSVFPTNSGLLKSFTG